jgi:ferritin-like metal-binding protein YciE
MVEAALDGELKETFQDHLEQTREHAERLRQLLAHLDQEAGGKKCDVMAGLIREGNKTIAQDAPPILKDAALIAAAQRVEHYEIAGYGCVRTYATLLGDEAAADVLQRTLDEESDADQLLTETAEQLNVQAGVLSTHA